jgi:hypothetical protein
MKTKYRITDSTIYKVRPVIDEYRVRIINETKLSPGVMIGKVARGISNVMGFLSIIMVVTALIGILPHDTGCIAIGACVFAIGFFFHLIAECFEEDRP